MQTDIGENHKLTPFYDDDLLSLPQTSARYSSIGHCVCGVPIVLLGMIRFSMKNVVIAPSMREKTFQRRIVEDTIRARRHCWWLETLLLWNFVVMEDVEICSARGSGYPILGKGLWLRTLRLGWFLEVIEMSKELGKY